MVLKIWLRSCHVFCASYHEVRYYLTSVADDEIKKIEQGSYLSHGIISSNGETNLIQETTDINTETMDGKDTFHSMARAVFQVQSSSDRPIVGPIKRSSDRFLHITEASSNIIACLPFKKPKKREEPVRWCICPNFVLWGKQCRNTKFRLGIIETFFLRNIIELPISSHLVKDQHIILFWTGYFRVTSKSPSFKKGCLSTDCRCKANWHDNCVHYHEKMCWNVHKGR